MSQKDSSSKQKIVPSGRRSRARLPAVTAGEDAEKNQAPGNGEAEGEGQDWKSKVMAGYKGKSPKSTHTLLAKISGDKAAVEVGERHKEKAIDDAMISFVDRMFDSFQNCAYEINRHAAGSELELNWIRPFKQKETVLSGWRNKQQDIIEVLSGRLSTRQWTLVVRGTPKDGITIHILPVDKLISFGTDQSEFKVYLTLAPSIEGLGVKWNVDEGKELTVDKWSDVYRELFEALIRHARGKALVDEKFNLKAVGIEPSKKDIRVNLDDVQRQYQEAFFEDMRKRAESSTSGLLPSPQAKRALPPNISTDGLSRPPLPQLPPRPPTPTFNSGQHQAVPEQRPAQQQPPQQQPPAQQPQPPYTPPPVPPGYMPSPNSWHGQQMPSAPHMVPPGQPKYPQMNPGYPQPQPGGYPPAPQQPPQNMQQPGMSPPMPQMPYGQQPMQQQPPHPQGQQPGANPNVSFPVALSMLLPTLDRELEVVAKAGMDAFSQRDLVRADAALKFSGRLSEFRTLALEILDYYKRK